MIENEILILRRVKHPNIVELIEEFETAKEIFLVMELVAVSICNVLLVTLNCNKIFKYSILELQIMKQRNLTIHVKCTLEIAGRF